MPSEVLMFLKGSVWLSNSWKQELTIRADGVEGEVIHGLRRTTMTLPYDRIAQVNLHRGVFAANLEVVNKGGSGNLTVRALSKVDAERAKALIDKQMLRAAKAHPAAPDLGTRIDQMEKLARLAKEGVLTQQEFESEKTRLLSSPTN